MRYVTTTTTTRRRRKKVLLLGVSYADCSKQLLSKTGGTVSEQNPQTSRLTNGTVEAAIQCVLEGILTQMDGRDLARCRGTETACGVSVYTVSQERGALYRPDRHLHSNFNRHDFVKKLQTHFGRECFFDQIVLDYFWIPPGWDVNHWGRSFFEKTLMDLADVLTPITGVVYLPFCLHCFKQVHSNFHKLRKKYNVGFLRKGQLDEITLWKGTQSIPEKVMQNVLGKHLNQEETYCTFGPRDVMEAMDDGNISKVQLVKLARSLEDFGDIRFLCLSLLKPGQITEGLFLGTMDPRKIKRGFDTLSNPFDEGKRASLSVPSSPPPKKARKLVSVTP